MFNSCTPKIYYLPKQANCISHKQLKQLIRAYYDQLGAPSEHMRLSEGIWNADACVGLLFLFPNQVLASHSPKLFYKVLVSEDQVYLNPYDSRKTHKIIDNLKKQVNDFQIKNQHLFSEREMLDIEESFLKGSELMEL